MEATNRLLSRIVPPEIGPMLARCHEKAGVAFRVGSMFESLSSSRLGKLKSAALSNGETLAGDLAVIGVGVTADTALARAAGLDVQVGIRADSSLRTSVPNIYACGDAVSFWHSLFERYIRVEAWQNGEEHAKVVAGQILGENLICDAVPFFWSDQYDRSLQIVGIPYFGSQLVTSALEDAKLFYRLNSRGVLVAATGLGHERIVGRKIAEARRLIKRRALLDLPMLKTGQIKVSASGAD